MEALDPISPGVAADGRRERLHVAYRAVLLAAGLLAAGLLVHELVGLLVGIIATIIVAIVLSAGASRLERWHVPRPMGAFLTLVALVLVLASALAVIVPTVVSQTTEFVDAAPQ